MKRLKYFFISLLALQTFSLAQDAAPQLETILGNEFGLIFTPLYVHDKVILDKKPGINLMPELWDRIKFTLKYGDKVLWHTRFVVGGNRDDTQKEYSFEGDSYSIKLDRSYLVYNPMEALSLKAGMDTSWSLFPGALSVTHDKVMTPLVEGGLGGRTSKRDLGGWLTYTPVKNSTAEISITPYLLAPKTKFTTGIMSTSNAPNREGFDPAKYISPLFTDDSTEYYRKLDSNKIPYMGLALGGYFLDKSIYLGGSYETSFLASHSFFGTFNLDKKADWHSAAFLEGSVNLGQYNVKHQNSLGLGMGYIGYFGPDNRHEIQVAYLLSLENPNVGNHLNKTKHEYLYNTNKTGEKAIDQATFKSLMSGRANIAQANFDDATAVDSALFGTVTAYNPLDAEYPSYNLVATQHFKLPYTDTPLKDMFYDIHSISLEGKFRVFSGDQLYFIAGINVTLPGKALSKIRRVMPTDKDGKRELARYEIPVSASAVLSINSTL